MAGLNSPASAHRQRGKVPNRITEPVVKDHSGSFLWNSQTGVLDVVSGAEADLTTANTELSALKEAINSHMAIPLTHDLSLKCHCCIASGVRGQQLGKWLEVVPGSTTRLFPEDVKAAKEAARARRTDFLLFMAVKLPAPLRSLSSSSVRSLI